ncbi:glycosyltransferase [Lysobacter xanthus]
MPLAGGGMSSVACLEGSMRTDVAAAFPDVPHAANAGFMLMAQLPADVDPAGEARFIARLDDGQHHEIAIPMEELPAQAPPRRGMRDMWARFRELGPGAVGPAAARRARALTRATMAWAARAALQLGRRRVVVVFDHALGGGANAFRQARMLELLARKRAVLQVSPDVQNLDYVLSLSTPRGATSQWRAPTLDAALRALSQFPLASIEINNLVSFDEPLRVVDWCVHQRPAGTELVYYLHDFHSVCPAFTLIDADGRYCGVPELDVCRACLPRNAANLLGFPAPADLGGWRGSWGELLRSADRVVAFSQASADILARAYPEVAERQRIELRPHRPDHSHLRPVSVRPSEVVTVGVIGNISRPKGADIVNAMAALVEAKNLPVRLVVIGTLQSGTSRNGRMLIHGSFAPDELPGLLERYQVDVCLMPSVCPETYSYVTDEIMAMEMPLVVFGIGAPAERVGRYTRGAVTADITAEAALADIMRLAERARSPLETRAREP